MTAQISNDIKYNGEVYQILYESEYLFEPEKFGFNDTYWNCTACYAGYMIDYKVENDKLIIERFAINDHTTNPPQFLGVIPAKGKSYNEADSLFESFDYIYNNVNQKLEYTGKIVIARIMATNYVYNGYQPFYNYEDVKELQFENGNVVKVYDLSDLAGRVRKKLQDEEAKCEAKAKKYEDGYEEGKYTFDEFFQASRWRRNFFDYRNIRNIIKGNFYDEYKTKMWWYKPEYN